MGRKATKNLNLPPHMRLRVRGDKKYYYYDTGSKPRVELPLGKCYVKAVMQWAQLEGKNQQPTIYFKDLSDRYQREVMPLKSKKSQDDNIVQMRQLLKFFNNPPAMVDEIKPVHIRQYLDYRTGNGKHSTTRANREKALLSHMFNKAREWGIINTENPTRGVKGYAEKGRDQYTEDNVYDAVFEISSEPLKNAIEIAYLIGQRPGDVMRLTVSDIVDGILYVIQAKTKQKIRISIEGQLKVLINNILLKKENQKYYSEKLITDAHGRAISQKKIRDEFAETRSRAAELNPELSVQILDYQFRDLRAKAVTDKAGNEGMRAAQMLAGHSQMKMTEKYTRNRLGTLVRPVK